MWSFINSLEIQRKIDSWCRRYDTTLCGKVSQNYSVLILLTYILQHSMDSGITQIITVLKEHYMSLEQQLVPYPTHSAPSVNCVNKIDASVSD